MHTQTRNKRTVAISTAKVVSRLILTGEPYRAQDGTVVDFYSEWFCCSINGGNKMLAMTQEEFLDAYRDEQWSRATDLIP